MKPYFLLSLTTTLLSILLLALSIAGVITSARALSLSHNRPYDPNSPYGQIYPQDQRDIRPGNSSPSVATGWYYPALPRNIQFGNERAVVGCSAVVLVLGVFIVGTSAFARVRPTYHSNPSGFPKLNIPLSLAILLTTLVGIIYTHTAISPSNYDFERFNSFPAPENLSLAERTVGDSGRFSLESWSCGLKGLVTRGFGQFEELDRTCGNAIAARWLMIPLFVVSVLLVPACVLTRRKAVEELEAAGGHKPISLGGVETREVLAQ